MNFLKNQFDKIQTVGAKVITEVGSRTENVRKNLGEKIESSKNGVLKALAEPVYFTEIIPRLYHMTYPQPNLMPKLSQQIHKNFGTNFRIWNVSEYTYPSGSFDDQVVEYVTCGYPNPTLAQLYMICKEMACF